MTDSRLAVLLGGRHVADLRRGAGRHGARLRYRDDADRRLSLSMPVRQRPYTAEQATSWLAGLLPGDPRVLRRWADEFGLPDATPFSLLSSPAGLDCAGAVQFCEPDAVDRVLSRPAARAPLSDREVADVILALHNDSAAWLGEPASLRFSLSGGEPKTALLRDGDRWFKPSGSTASTHILKPELAVRRYDALPLNEHLCQTAAAGLGLPAAATEIVELGGIQTVIIERYDRHRTDAGIKRIHQEDACQALGLPPAKKYERHGGPGIARVGELIREHSSDPERDISRYLDALTFNWLLAGSDAHAKNYSFFLDADSVRLAPLYDIASALPYCDTHGQVRKIRLAQKIGRGYTLRRADRRSAWELLADTLGLSADDTIEHAETMADRAVPAFEAAIDGLAAPFRAHPIVNTLLRRLHRRIRTCRTVGSIVGPRDSPATGNGPVSGPAVASGSKPDVDVSTSSRRTSGSRCGRLMPRARRRCRRLAGHSGACR